MRMHELAFPMDGGGHVETCHAATVPTNAINASPLFSLPSDMAPTMRKSAAAPVRAVEAESPSTERAQKRKAPNLPWAEMKTDTEDTKYFTLHDKVDIKNFLAGYAVPVPVPTKTCVIALAQRTFTSPGPWPLN